MATVSASSIRLSDPAGGRADAAWGLPFGTVVLPLMIARPALENALGLVRVSVGPTALSVGFLFNILMVMLAGVLAGYALLVDRRRQRHVLLIGVIWGPFLLAAVIAAVRSPVPVDAIQVLFNYLTYAAVSFTALTYGPGLNRQSLTTIVALSGIIPLGYGLLQAATGLGQERIASTFSHPNVLAFFMLIYASFLFHAQLSGYIRSPGWKTIIWFLIAAALLALLLTGTRSAYIAIYIFLFCYSAVRKPVFLIPLLLLIPMALLIPQVAHRVDSAFSGSTPVSYDYLVSAMRGDVADSGSIDLDSGTWRRYLWQAAWPWIEQTPLLGHGLASFTFYSSSFFPLSAGQGSGAHNVYVQLAFEGGALLLIAYFTNCLFTLLFHFNNFKRDRYGSIYVILLLLIFAVASASDNMLNYLSVNVMLFFVAFALPGLADIGPRMARGAIYSTRRSLKRGV